MRLTECNTEMPAWLYDNINKRCPHCGAHICDDGPVVNGVMQLTQRYCINPRCPGHMAHKMDILAKRFGVKGFGPETALSLCKVNKYQNHLEILKKWFPDSKPKVHLWEVGDLAMIYGFGGSWKELVLGYSSFEEFFKTATMIPEAIRCNEEYLLYCEQFFEVKPPLSKNVVNIMMTGSINGFSNRAQFVEAVNLTFGKYVQVIDVGKRVRGVSYLVKEQGTVDHSKSDLANANGIPIVTPIEFLTKIGEMVTYKCEKEEEV